MNTDHYDQNTLRVFDTTWVPMADFNIQYFCSVFTGAALVGQGGVPVCWMFSLFAHVALAARPI